jgi:hypothetical protein
MVRCRIAPRLPDSWMAINRLPSSLGVQARIAAFCNSLTASTFGSNGVSPYLRITPAYVSGCLSNDCLQPAQQK